MKRNDLLKRIAKIAKATSTTWELGRQGANHEIWYYGERRVVIPRHNEINEITAKSILNYIKDET